ncbi:hypothetical protein PRIPAC_86229 [Pristionchus pacificus]|nr:hypothetical protein PRIPAC_86229 [Pristionchus pacificus]
MRSFTLFSFIYLAKGYNITLYSLPDWDETLGKTFDIVNDSCVSIPQSFLTEDDGVSGVWTKGPCVILYEKFDCAGDYIKVRKGAILNGQLSSIDFDNRARSSGPCETSTSTSVTDAFDRDPNTLLIILFCVVNGGVLFYLFLGTRMEKEPVQTSSTNEKKIID